METIRSWIKGPGLSFTSPQDGTLLELPLKVVAPLLSPANATATGKPNGSRKRPKLIKISRTSFSDSRQPETPSAAPAQARPSQTKGSN